MAFIDYLRNIKKTKNEPNKVSEKIAYLPTFSDEDLGLYWTRITNENLDENEKYFEQMSAWSDSMSIRRFIASKTPINEIFREYVVSEKPASLEGKNNLYFCFDDSASFLGLAYISSPMGRNKHSTLEYLIVNPEFQGKGVGTRMVKSISTYMNYFNNGNQSNGMLSSVEEDNIASSRAFLKNNYKVISSNTSDTGRKYNVYYLSARDIVSESDGMVG